MSPFALLPIPHPLTARCSLFQPSMEQAITFALQKFFTPKSTEKKASHPRSEFYAKYKQEAEHADKDFQKKYEEDLNTTLIFVCPPACPHILS